MMSKTLPGGNSGGNIEHRFGASVPKQLITSPVPRPIMPGITTPSSKRPWWHIGMPSSPVPGSPIIPGEQLSPAVPIHDLQNNIYETVRIGNLCITTKGWKGTLDADENPIPHLGYSTAFNWEWNHATTSKRSSVPNIQGYQNIYGWLYNYYCSQPGGLWIPPDWRIPTKDDWTHIMQIIDPEGIVIEPNEVISSNAGFHMKANVDLPSGWEEGQGGDTYGFNGLPGGYRNGSGYVWPNGMGTYWTANGGISGGVSLSAFNDECRWFYSSSQMHPPGRHIRLVKDCGL